MDDILCVPQILFSLVSCLHQLRVGGAIWRKHHPRVVAGSNVFSVRAKGTEADKQKFRRSHSRVTSKYPELSGNGARGYD